MTNVSPRRWFAFPLLLLTPWGAAACSSTPPTTTTVPEAAPEAAAEPTRAPAAPVNGHGTPAPAASPQDPSGFEGARQAESLKLQRQEFLVNEYMEKGKAAYNALDFVGARRDFASALEVDPTHKEALEWLQRTQAALGEVGPVRREDLRDKSDFELVRQAEARQTVAQSILDGDRAMELRRYDEAIKHYRTAEQILEYFPLLAAERNEARAVAAKIDEALRRKDEARREDEAALLRQAEAERRERERETRQQLENQIRGLYEQANLDYLNGRYAEAERSLDLLLEIDPKNDRARELRDIAAQARNEALDRLTRKTFSQRWRQAFAEVDRMGLPQTETIVHDPLHWEEVSQRKPLQIQNVGETRTPEDLAVLARLDEVRFEPRFSNRPIEEIVGYLRNLTQVNFIVSPKIMEMDEGQRSVSIDLPRKSVREFLTVLQLVKNFAWRVEDGVVRIGTPEEMKGQTEVRTYEVGDLIQVIPHFAGPEITLQPTGGATIPAGEDPEAQGVFTADQIQQLITGTIAPASWSDAEAKTAIRMMPSSGTLVVRQTPEVHDQIDRFLNDLRESTGLMVEVQTRFIIAEDNFLEDIGVDWRGLGDNGNSGVAPVGGLGTAPPFDDFGASPLPGTPSQPGPLGTGNQPGFFTSTGSVPIIGKTENIFDQTLSGTNPLTASGGLSLQWINLGDRESELILRATEKSERVELVTAPRLLVHNAERSTLSVTNQFAYVSGYGVEIAQAASIADPQIDIIQDGAILDVRPVVSADRKFVKLELRPTLASLRLPIESRVVGVGNGTPVTIQFPNLTVRKVRTTVNVPDGGTLLLGGQTIDERRNESAGVPFLRDLPVIGFFFDRKGQSISKRRLLILLRVKIVIPKEYEPRPRLRTSPLAPSAASFTAAR